MAARQVHMRPGCEYTQVVTNGKWNGRAAVQENMLEKPLRRKKPTTYFVNSMGDFFLADVSMYAQRRVLNVMLKATQHKFMLLTKRPLTMYRFFRRLTAFEWPLDNVAIGVSVENADVTVRRVRQLVQTPAQFRFVSVEPMLGPVNLRPWLKDLDLVICGGETGPGARPMPAEAAYALALDCQKYGVPFFFKKWGANGGRQLLGKEWNGVIDWERAGGEVLGADLTKDE
jgi:protein gp37